MRDERGSPPITNPSRTPGRPMEADERSSTAPPSVSVIVVNWDRCEDLRQCLESVASQDYEPKEILVVDNGSIDDSCDMVRREFPSVRLIRLELNIGCPGGRNVGILNAIGDVLVFLDNDATMEPGVISGVIAALSDDPATGAVVPRTIDYTSGEPRPIGDGSHSVPTYLSTLFGTSAIRREVFEEVGLYPADYVYGGEEADLSIRLLEADFRIRYWPSLVVWHKISNLARNRRREFGSRFRNSTLTLWRYAPIPVALVRGTMLHAAFGREAMRTGYIGQYIKTSISLPFAVLRVLASERSPVRNATLALTDYLSENTVADWDTLEQEDISTFQLLMSQVRVRFSRALRTK